MSHKTIYFSDEELAYIDGHEGQTRSGVIRDALTLYRKVEDLTDSGELTIATVEQALDYYIRNARIEYECSRCGAQIRAPVGATTCCECSGALKQVEVAQ